MNKGISLYLVIVILTVSMTVILGLVVLLIGEIQIISPLGDSIVAFYAADAGIEHSLYNLRKEPYGTGIVTGELIIRDNLKASYTVSVEGSKHISYGNYKETNRAIEIEY
ncbi:hypothetical protein COS93_01440 [bacterium (Candidatus Gribaldobacteria) CG07_land_8_20_14_0_80_33_18]|uniref:Type 4 fimbrial biogenesis protein PilX N-terminal domain-containing protein n=1 Tax=bacterium (Candidatus Gribaldobacteria) CG07_land_8_20_14_0_80_33_18 TaxID=2014272 RepID=A0A2M6Z3E0_9BACT|nr:MAG: hypothetical protein COU04_01200 [bacterium (Candidatus Gribaldobacteria) CG10_big_fil_rev_8_21_14_0_10_33_41]PIU46900.1 MAG: hypothetical protein COS93_01440 [bacterium (Candidatus Gribaldobacteria) CG07_land_8_20_14_0_80_33_18]PJA01121.1 MAG: hypothetical protein COX75_00600 [bacterium (Candidatus Gribaldobacteria) CG_4_10_14_0_2_um_filter_33_15]